MATWVELLTADLIFLSKYFCKATLNKKSENIAIKSEGIKVVAEKKVKYLKLVSAPISPFFFDDRNRGKNFGVFVLMLVYLSCSL